MYDAFVAYGLQYLLHKRRMKFYRKMYAAALLCEFLQHVGRILNAYFPKGKLAEIFLTAVQCGMPHREGVRRLLYDLDFNHGSLRFRSWDIILLTSFIKRQPRDTMKALDQSLYILSDIQQHPDRTSNFDFQREATA